MQSPIVIIGIGELGGIFARGFLRLGRPLYPVTRATPMAAVAEELTEPELVLVAVAEGDLAPLFDALPDTWRGCVGLIQNELLPDHWKGIPAPTVISVLFEKKPGTDPRVIIPSPVFGPRSDLLAAAFARLGIPTRILAEPDELLFELVVKNLYILTTNIAGLRVGGTVGELWARHREFARRIGDDVIRLQEVLTGRRFEQEALFAAMIEAFEGDPSHECNGPQCSGTARACLGRGKTPRTRSLCPAGDACSPGLRCAVTATSPVRYR